MSGLAEEDARGAEDAGETAGLWGRLPPTSLGPGSAHTHDPLPKAWPHSHCLRPQNSQLCPDTLQV